MLASKFYFGLDVPDLFNRILDECIGDLSPVDSGYSVRNPLGGYLSEKSVTPKSEQRPLHAESIRPLPL